jgi:hypothetical protein
MHRALPVHAADYFGPAIGAVAFVVVMSLLREPTRRTFNAIFVAGAMGETSSFGCSIFDAGIAVWFLAGAPSVVKALRA